MATNVVILQHQATYIYNKKRHKTRLHRTRSCKNKIVIENKAFKAKKVKKYAVTLKDNNGKALKKAKLILKVKGKKLNCYISVGEKDFIIEASRKLNDHLKENEIDASYKFIPDFDHSWSLWREEIVEVFNILKTKGLIG